MAVLRSGEPSKRTNLLLINEMWFIDVAVNKDQAVTKVERRRRERRYPWPVPEYRFTDYFEKEVLRKRPYLKKEWCTRVLDNPVRSEPQEKNRHRFWAPVPELENRYLRVVTLDDKLTIHNAFPDRGFQL
jgi:hypothetical protein